MSESEKKKNSFLDSFRIHDATSCARAIRYGGRIGLFSAGITALFATIGIFTSSANKTLAAFLDPWSLVDAALCVVLSIFVFRKSRVAATLLFVYFVFSKIYLYSEVGAANGIIVTLIVGAYYFNSMRATYLWRSSYCAGQAALEKTVSTDPGGVDE